MTYRHGTDAFPVELVGREVWALDKDKGWYPLVFGKLEESRNEYGFSVTYNDGNWGRCTRPTREYSTLCETPEEALAILKQWQNEENAAFAAQAEAFRAKLREHGGYVVFRTLKETKAARFFFGPGMKKRPTQGGTYLFLMIGDRDGGPTVWRARLENDCESTDGQPFGIKRTLHDAFGDADKTDEALVWCKYAAAEMPGIAAAFEAWMAENSPTNEVNRYAAQIQWLENHIGKEEPK